MSEIMKDSAIKLFGKTITLLPDDVVSDVYVSEQRQSSFATSTSPDHKDEHESTDPTRETLTEASTTSNIEDEANTPETPKKEESHDSNTPEEKPLKKPDKILPCPRCKSMDTKFCYYNNYNVNQPRYFCKNCQRYWTSGGTMRNVPVGSGRRKIKNLNQNPGEPGFLIGPDSGFPVSFYPATTYWTVPLVASSLGKHSREENMVRTSQDNLKAKISVWTPNTLRVHNQSEAAKSSVWVTLGRIENQKTGLFNGSGLFKAFGSRGVDSATIVRQANPAALSRSRA